MNHACNQICGATKSFCDNNFLKCIDAKCNALDEGEKKKDCESAVATHKIMIQLSQCKEFDQGQKKNCKCVPKSEADDERVKIITSFYEKYSPKDVSKAATLAKKATDGNKLAGLLYKLVEKYPASVKRVKTQQDQMMEDIMSGKYADMKKVNTDSDSENADEIEDEGEERIEL